ncbi:MAG: hypothetical protein P8P34_01050 [Flavobacteriaceae bacterium]|nr:hypothetical protein [Flavobacteriaceae bacterium]
MPGKNWNSEKKTYTDLKGKETILKASKARELQKKGVSVKKISEIIGVSTSRIYEYLR